MTAASKSSNRAQATALACAFAYLALTGCATQPKPEAAARSQDPAKVLAEFAEYANWLARQSATEIEVERKRLQALPASPAQSLRLALLHGQRRSSAYDPQLAARLLSQIAASEPQTSVQAQIAQVLFAGQPDPMACADAERLSKLSNDLGIELGELQELQQTAQSQLETARVQLETERAERARLENQLKALKSLEAQIKGRDNASAP